MDPDRPGGDGPGATDPLAKVPAAPQPLRPSEIETVVLVVDPHAARGAAARELPDVQRAIAETGHQVRTLSVNGRAEARQAVRRAVREGERYLAVLGTDHLVHDAINGLLEDQAPLAPDAVLAVIPVGLESDFAKTFGLPEEPVAGAGRVAGDVVYPMDVGLITCRDRRGHERTEYFGSIAEAGLGGQVVARAGRLPFRSPRTRYFTSFWRTLATYRRPTVTVVSGTRRFAGKATNVLVGNGQYQAGGVRVSPRGFPGDGFFEVQIWTGPRSDHFTMLPKMFWGEHPQAVNVKL